MHLSFPQSNPSTLLHRRLPTRQILALHRFNLRRPSPSLPRLPRKRYGRPFPLFDTGKPSASNYYYYNVLNPNQADEALSGAHIAEGATIRVGPKIRSRLCRNPQTYRLIDAKLLDHVRSVSVTSDHLTLRVRIALSATAVSISIPVDVVLHFGCLFL